MLRLWGTAVSEELVVVSVTDIMCLLCLVMRAVTRKCLGPTPESERSRLNQCFLLRVLIFHDYFFEMVWNLNVDLCMYVHVINCQLLCTLFY